LFAAKRVPAGKVHAFEPVAEAFARLSANVQRNHFSNVVLHNQGLMDRAASLPIYRQSGRFDDGSRNTGLYTVYSHADRNQVIEEIHVVRLDDLVEREEVELPTIMKIDVEGAEIGVLRGAERTLSRARPVLIVELAERTLRAAGTSPREVVSLLEALVYRIEIIGYMGATSPLDPANIPAYCNVVCFPNHVEKH
jgi:FkbM family methyltransferase